MFHNRAFFSGSILAAYLALGSGSYVVTPHNLSARHQVAVFAATLPRRVYRYSVVPGGVYTAEELAAARRSDPVVAAHFADFGANTTITKLKEDIYVYISYRKGAQVYYSKKKHKVCKGEVVITDGKNYARTRCANRLTKVFKPPALTYNEPKPPELDIIEPPDANYGDLPADPQLTQNYNMYPRVEEYPMPNAQTGATPGAAPYRADLPSEVILPQFAPLGGIAPAAFAPSVTPPVTPPVVVPPGTPPGTAVPEPATLGLFFAGFASLLALRKK